MRDFAWDCTMMSKEEMFAPMLEACASFEPAWAEFVAESARHEPEEPLYYVALHTLAEHLLDLFARGHTSELSAVFAVVEGWLRDGDAYVRNATVVGLFESMQNLAGWRDQDISGLQRWLQPESKKW